MPATIFPFTKNSNVISAPTPTPALSELLARYDIPGPRYTSYPTIDQCTESVGAIDFEDALRSRCLGGLRRPMSLCAIL